jgi:hypothetical protein
VQSTRKMSALNEKCTSGMPPKFEGGVASPHPPQTWKLEIFVIRVEPKVIDYLTVIQPFLISIVDSFFTSTLPQEVSMVATVPLP